MAIIAKFTRTLPAPSATISGGFVFLLSAGWFTQAGTGVAGSPVDGGTNSLANGGGDMKIFSDALATTQLPIEVVSFITGGSPSAQVWVRTPGYTSGDTITIGKDDNQTVQPIVTATYGRNATWVDFEAVIHANETSSNGVFTDSSGNGHDTTLTSGSSLGTTSSGHPFDGTWPDFTAQQAITLANSYAAINNTAFTLSCWMNGDTNDNNKGLFGNRYQSPSDSQWAQLQEGGRCFTKAATTENFINTTQQAGATRLFKLKQDNSSLQVVVSGVTVGTNATVTDGEAINNTSTTSNFRVGTYYNAASNRSYNGRAGEFRIKRIKDSGDFDLSEYDNQNDPDNFGTSSEYVLVGGSGLDAAVVSQMPLMTSLATITQSAPSINLSASIASLMPKMTSLVSFTQSAPTENSAVLISTMPSMISSAAFQNLTPGNNSSVSSIMPSMISSATFTIDGPKILDAVIVSNMPFLQSSATLFNGIISIVIGEGNNIDNVVKSRNINIKTKSRVI